MKTLLTILLAFGLSADCFTQGVQINFLDDKRYQVIDTRDGYVYGDNVPTVLLGLETAWICVATTKNRYYLKIVAKREDKYSLSSQEVGNQLRVCQNQECYLIDNRAELKILVGLLH